MTNKYADPVEIWKTGEGTPDQATVTLELVGPGTGIVVTDVLQYYIAYLGNPTIAPDTVVSGTATAGTATSMTDTSKDFVALGVSVGMRILNTNDNSSGVITGVTTTELTFSGGLTGGTANAFDTGNAYSITYPSTNPTTGKTTLKWTVGDLGMGESWEVSFDVSTTEAGKEVPVDVVAASENKATYTDWKGETKSKDFPQANIMVKTLLVAEKSVSPVNMWLEEKGTPDKSTVTLKVTGPGEDTVVTEVLPDYLNLIEGSLTETPDTDYPEIDATGKTIIKWTIGSLDLGAVWEVSFEVSSSKVGTDLPVDVESEAKVSYNDWGGVAQTAAFPQAFISVYAPVMVDKSANPTDLAESASIPYKSTVILTVTGPGEDIVVTEVLQDYISPIEGSYTVAPDSGYPSGKTLKWTVGTLGVGEIWKASFDVSSTKAGTKLAVDVEADSKVTYTAWEGISVAFPQVYLTVPELTVDKLATPVDLWQEGVGTPYKSTVILTVTGPGKDIVVTDVLQDYINPIEGSYTKTPDSGYPSGKTLKWTVGTLLAGEVWQVSFDVTSTEAGTKLPVDVEEESKVTYTGSGEVTMVFPQQYISVKAPLMVEVNIAPVYFAGLTAEAYILTTVGGKPHDADIDSIILYFGDGTEYEDLTAGVEPVPDAEGLYRVEYKVPSGAPMGGYKIVVAASSVGLYGTSSGIFQVLTIPMELYGYPIWIFAIAAVVLLFIFMMIAVRIATRR